MASPGMPLFGVPNAPNNPLGWPTNTGANAAPGTSGAPTAGPTGANLFSPQAPNVGGITGNNPYGQGTRGGGNQGFNLAQTNLITGLQKNATIPAMLQAMFGAGGGAGNFFQTLMNLGSPYYQQQQAATATQGAQQNAQASAQTREQQAAEGYGFTPSGAGAAAEAQQAQTGAQDMVSNWLQNLFQNEAMQLQGAQGLAQIAQLFNPSQMFGSINPSIQQPTNTGAEWLSAASSLLPQGSYKVGG